MNDKYEEGYIPFAYLDTTEDDFCKHCGAKLETSSTEVPYGDAMYSLREYYCPNNCD